MKTMKTMKTMKHFLSMAALALMGAMMTGCSNDDNIDNAQQPESKSKLETLTTTISLGEDGTTRALTPEGVKTFAAGDQIAVLYWDTNYTIKKATSTELKTTDISNEGKTATFTVTLSDPEKTQMVYYVYPASMIKDDGMVNVAALMTQDGTLDTLGSSLEYAMGYGNWNGEELPSLDLENQLAILAITLKDADGTNDITSTITGMTLSDGIYTYTVTREAAAGPIYVAINGVFNRNVTITATDGTKNYFKSLTGKNYDINNGYDVSWRMTQGAHLAALTANYTAKDGDVLTGTLGANVKISIADGAAVTLDGVSINANGTWESGDYAGLTPLGDATITLKEGTTNTVKGFNQDYPGIYAAKDKTLIINGEGSLNVSSNGMAAGIGSGWWVESGDIEIQSGTIVAEGGSLGSGIGGAGSNNGHCGNITILGGNIQATGGNAAAGIGAACGNGGDITIGGGSITAEGGGAGAGIGCGGGTIGSITITAGLINATGGLGAAGIGPGSGGDCSKITIQGGTVNATGGDYYPDGDGAGAGIGTGADYSTCNNITITGGTIEAIGGKDDESGEGKTGAGIGTGTSSSCEGISITAQVIQVTATKGGDGSESIGAGKDGYLYNDVSIEAGANVIQN